MVKRPQRQRAEAGQGDGWQRAGGCDPARAEVRGQFLYIRFLQAAGYDDRRRGRCPGTFFAYKIFLQRPAEGRAQQPLDMQKHKKIKT
jgi:hypothetical protein